ncbi:MAG: GPR endopeptidase, partial [Clostridia bacterium]
KINPEFIIVIDALASRRLERLATTVQLASTGISPGSGVCNSRSEISLKTTGYPVISMGFPTVVDAATLAADLLEKAECDENIRDKISEKLMGGEGKNMFVAPKESDLITNELSRLAAEAINLLVHSELLLEDIEEFK